MCPIPMDGISNVGDCYRCTAAMLDENGWRNPWMFRRTMGALGFHGFGFTTRPMNRMLSVRLSRMKKTNG